MNYVKTNWCDSISKAFCLYSSFKWDTQQYLCTRAYLGLKDNLKHERTFASPIVSDHTGPPGTGSKWHRLQQATRQYFSAVVTIHVKNWFTIAIT